MCYTEGTMEPQPQTSQFFTPFEDIQGAKTQLVRGNKHMPFNLKELYYLHWKNRLTHAALSCFRWEGFGEHITSERIEQVLLEYGFGVFYMQPAGELVEWGTGETLDAPRFTFRPASQGGMLNDLNNATRFMTIQPNGAGREVHTIGELDKWTGIPVWENLRHDFYVRDAINLHSWRLANAAAILDHNLANTATQRIVAGTEEERRTLSDINDMMGMGNFAIEWNSKLGNIEDRIKVLDLGVDAHIPEVNHAVFIRLMGEAYNALGIKAQANEKTAQQTVAEVESTSGLIDSIRISRLQAREQAADRFNKRYGTAVRVVDTGTGEGE